MKEIKMMETKMKESTWSQEIIENYVSVKKIYENIENTLELDFDGFYTFFQNILHTSYDYVILMSRRCLVLYQIYELFFAYNNDEVSFAGTIISDKAIPYFCTKMKAGDRIVIVDDIIVHGRTVSHVYQFLKEQCPGAEIEIKSYMAENTMDCVSEEIRKKIEVLYFASTYEWRDLSNRIVSCIMEANVPYTSFVTAFYQYEKSSLMDELRAINNIEIIPNEDDIQKKKKIKSYYICERKWNKPEFFSKLSLGECVRIYWNEDTDKFTVIPYVFLRSLKINNAQEIIEQIKELIPDNYPIVKKVMGEVGNTDRHSSALEEYKMRILTCVLSNIYWEEFKNRYSLPQPQYCDLDTLYKSFGTPIADEMVKMRKGDEFKALLAYAPVIEDPFTTGNSEMTKLFEEKYTSKWIKSYLFKAWMRDEKQARMDKAREKGVLVEDFLQKIEAYNLSQTWVMAKVVNCWDIGISAGNFLLNTDEGLVGCFISPGEQSYKIIIENNPKVMSALVQISNMVTKGDTHRANESFEEYRVEMLTELLDQFNRKKAITDYSEIKEIIKGNNGYMNSWNQPLVMHYYSQEQDIDCEYDEILQEFLKEKKLARR